MPISPAENSFQKGMTALQNGRPDEAAALFESAIRIESKRAVARPQMRYLSYYGLSSALAGRATPEAIQACEMAARTDFFNPELHLNLGRVYMLAGKTTRALAAFERGLQIAPGNRPLRAERKKADRRGRPALPMLGRNHPINRFLGRMRCYWREAFSAR